MLEALLFDFVDSTFKKEEILENITNIEEKGLSISISYAYFDRHGYEQSDTKSFSILDILAFAYSELKKEED